MRAWRTPSTCICAPEVVAVGPQADQFASVALELPFLERVVLRAHRPQDLPLGHSGRSLSLSDGRTIALVCAGQKCSLPIIDPQQILPGRSRKRGWAVAALEA